MDNTSLILICLIFLWTGFVRTGFGFGGAVLGLPFMLLVSGTPIYWLPIIGIHLLFFSSLTLAGSFKQIDWKYLRYSLIWIIIPTLIGVIGLLNLPDNITTIFIYVVIMLYSISWMFNKSFSYNSVVIDRILFVIAGYIAGTSLIGAPLMVAIYMRHVDKVCLRSTLFVLWIILVSIKMLAFLVAEVYIDWTFALWLIPIAFIGHFLGNKVHNILIAHNKIFKPSLGGLLFVVSSFGLFNFLTI